MVTGGVAAQGDEALHAHAGELGDYRVDVAARGVDAGEMRRRRQLRTGQDTVDRARGALAGRAAGAVGDGHEAGGERLKPLHEGAPVCEVEVLHAPERPARPADAKPVQGPARVSTDSYRKGWSAVFGAKKKRAYDVN